MRRSHRRRPRRGAAPVGDCRFPAFHTGYPETCEHPQQPAHWGDFACGPTRRNCSDCSSATAFPSHGRGRTASCVRRCPSGDGCALPGRGRTFVREVAGPDRVRRRCCSPRIDGEWRPQLVPHLRPARGRVPRARHPICAATRAASVRVDAFRLADCADDLAALLDALATGPGDRRRLLDGRAGGRSFSPGATRIRSPDSCCARRRPGSPRPRSARRRSMPYSVWSRPARGSADAPPTCRPRRCGHFAACGRTRPRDFVQLDDRGVPSS